VKKIIPVAATLGALTAVVIGCGSSTPAANESRAQPATAAPAPSAAPTANPDGSWSASCDTSLGAGINDANYLTGEVDLVNTGNVGTVVRVRFAWKQEAYPSIVLFKTVRTHPGQHYVVRFHYNAGTFATSTAPLDRDQSWQENHGFRMPCSASATIMRSFGPAQ
jgi:hypothetical protein